MHSEVDEQHRLNFYVFGFDIILNDTRRKVSWVGQICFLVYSDLIDLELLGCPLILNYENMSIPLIFICTAHGMKY